MKKWLSILLILIFCISLVPVQTFADLPATEETEDLPVPEEKENLPAEKTVFSEESDFSAETEPAEANVPAGEADPENEKVCADEITPSEEMLSSGEELSSNIPQTCEEPETHEFRYINPIYEDVVFEEDLPVPELTEEDLEIFNDLAETAPPQENSFQLFASFNSDSAYSDIDEAGSELKLKLEERQEEIMLYFESPVQETWENLCVNIYYSAVAHTGVPTEGDYLHYEYGGFGAGGGGPNYNEATGMYVYMFKYQPLFYTTAEQERELNLAVSSILAELNLEGKTNYQKIRAVYDYLCDTVSYDYDNLNNKNYTLKFTAYAALIDHTAVCQGYATAFYRLCLELGIDTRVVTNVGLKHAWNIVQFRDVYYELDSTWDAGKDSYDNFLKGGTYWCSSHGSLGDEFTGGRFSYNVPDEDAPVSYTLSFHANGGTEAPDTQTIMLGEYCPASYTAGGYAGHIFAGWADSDDEYSVDYWPEDNLISDTDIDLYAVWVVPGSVTGSGEVSVRDAYCLRLHLAGLMESPFSREQNLAADVYTDGKVNLIDAAFILRYCAGLMDSLPVY